MSARRPLQPLSPLSANIVGAKHSYIAKTVANVDVSAMDDRVQDEDTQEGSIISGLTELEESADDFEKLLIQNARDERRLHEALRGNIQPFRKARKVPRTALTLESLERNEATNNAPNTIPAQRKPPSPPSASSGSSRSDTGVRPPQGWGRRARVRRDWMRTIAMDMDDGVNGGGAGAGAGAGAQEDMGSDDATPRRAAGADHALPSVEDSPLSRKSSHQGTPASTRRRQAQQEPAEGWDDTIDINEASMLVSTPFIPRNTVLDEIRQREIESLREQAVTTNRLDRIRESSPQETRRPRSSSAKSLASDTNPAPNAVITTEQTTYDFGSQEVRSRKRIESWKTIGKSQPSTSATSEGTEPATQPPFVVYKKSSETVGVVDRGVLANGQTSPQRPTHKREDSHELLRRLARVSSGTPSPGRAAISRPQSAPPPKQDSNPLQPPPTNMLSTSLDDVRSLGQTSDRPVPTEDEPDVKSEEKQAVDADVKADAAPVREPPADVDATPMPVERSELQAKTPQVMGGWIDTPAPARVAPPPTEEPRSDSRRRSPTKGSPEKRPTVKSEEPPQGSSVVKERTRPTLPKSALGAIVEEARSNPQGQRREDSYGDSTIDSLEDIVASDRNDNYTADETGLEDDTLQGLKLPTGAPRNEAERQRQQELVHLHRMNDRLRAARTSIRDANRGMKRVEHVMEHVDENGGRVQVVYRECPCAANGGHQCHPWRALRQGFTRLFYDKSNMRRTGLTWLSIALIACVVYYVAEVVACDYHCHKLYAYSMTGFGVRENAPRWPFVIPTLIYRNLIAAWWTPIWRVLSWIARTAWHSVCGDEVGQSQVKGKVTRTVTRTIRRTATSSYRSQFTGAYDDALRMGNDEAI